MTEGKGLEMDKPIDEQELRNKLSRLEDKIAELKDEADDVRKLLGLKPTLSIPASRYTIDLLDELRAKWGDDKRTALMRCVERVHSAYLT